MCHKGMIIYSSYKLGLFPIFSSDYTCSWRFRQGTELLGVGSPYLCRLSWWAYGVPLIVNSVCDWSVPDCVRWFNRTRFDELAHCSVLSFHWKDPYGSLLSWQPFALYSRGFWSDFPGIRVICQIILTSLHVGVHHDNTYRILVRTGWDISMIFQQGKIWGLHTRIHIRPSR